MEKTFQTALEFIRQNGLTGYEVVNENKTNSFVFKYNTELSPDDNLSRLRAVMAITPGSWFTLIGWTTGEKNRVQYKYEFANESRTPSGRTDGAAPAAVAGVSREELEEQIRLAEARVEQRYRMKELERREKELGEREREFRREKESAIGIAISQIGKFLRAAQPAIAGTGDSPLRQVPAPTDTDQDPDTGKDPETAEIEALLTAWAEADSEWFALLQKIVDMARNRDPRYGMAKQLI